MRDLDARRAQLRAAVDRGDLDSLVAALSGTDEDARQRLAKTLPPSRLIRQEGSTPRACYALAALGKPKFAAETMAQTDLPNRSQQRIQAATAALLSAAVERDQAWRAEFVDAFLGEHWWSGRSLVWSVAAPLVHEHGVQPSATFLDHFVANATGDAAGLRPEELGAQIAQRLLTTPFFLDSDFWGLFRNEGPGGNYLLTEYAAEAWDVAILALAQGASLRARILDESLAALSRDFAPRNTIWYRRIQRLLEPTPAEVSDRATSYLGLLGNQASTSVGLALEVLTPAAKQGLLPAESVVEASAGVLGRTEKKLIKAQLQLLHAIELDSQQRDQVTDMVGAMAHSWSPDLRKLAGEYLQEVGPQETIGSQLAVKPPKVPSPRSSALPPALVDPGLQTDDELFGLLAEQLEGVGRGGELPRILSYLADNPQLAAPGALARRARDVLEHIRDEADASPRRHLAAVLLKGECPRFRGYLKYVVVSAAKASPPGAKLEERAISYATLDQSSGQWQTETWTSRSGYQDFPTDSATALLAETMRKVRLFRKAGRPIALPVPPEAVVRDWVREIRSPGPGTFSRDLEVLGAQPRPFWLAEPHAADTSDRFSARALSVQAVPAEFTFRAQEGREQDGFDQIVGWAGWLLQNNIDTFAAQFHPLLYAATAVVNVRGVGEVLGRIGSCRQLPGPPIYSALVLGASGKEQPNRAAAAEALASLCDNGLLDPVGFAEQLSLLLSEGFAQVGRVASTLADAASISALAGYRVLQTLAELLPRLARVRQVAPLVALLARLARDYGTPVPIPDEAFRGVKPGSVLGAALGELAAVPAGETSLASQAVTEAARTLGSGT